MPGAGPRLQGLLEVQDDEPEGDLEPGYEVAHGLTPADATSFRDFAMLQVSVM